MSDVHNAQGILDVIHTIASNREPRLANRNRHTGLTVLFWLALLRDQRIVDVDGGHRAFRCGNNSQL
jgi:hypothetical protein